MTYTTEQKERMVAKLMAMPSGTEFKLNKNDDCPLNVRIEKTLAGGKTYLYLVDVETDNNMIVCGFLYGQHDRNECYAKMVDVHQLKVARITDKRIMNLLWID